MNKRKPFKMAYTKKQIELIINVANGKCN